MELSKERLERLRELLAPAHQQIVIVSHTNPDGDAVGSSLAWAEALRSMGHEVTCVVPNKYPYFLDWMQGIEEVVVFKNDTEGRAARAIADADILFCLDFNAVSRLEILSETIGANTTARRVLIDHHLSPDEGFDLSFSHPDSSSTCFLVYSIVEALFGAQAVTRRMAEALYVGIMTDTGNFAYSFLTPELFRAVGVLGVLYITEFNGETVQSLADLKGKTIYATGKGSTPEYFLRYLLAENGLDLDTDVTVEWKSEPSEVVALLKAENGGIAMLPQPYVTAAAAQLGEGFGVARIAC